MNPRNMAKHEAYNNKSEQELLLDYRQFEQNLEARKRSYRKDQIQDYVLLGTVAAVCLAAVVTVVVAPPIGAIALGMIAAAATIGLKGAWNHLVERINEKKKDEKEILELTQSKDRAMQKLRDNGYSLERQGTKVVIKNKEGNEVDLVDQSKLEPPEERSKLINIIKHLWPWKKPNNNEIPSLATPTLLSKEEQAKEIRSSENITSDSASTAFRRKPNFSSNNKSKIKFSTRLKKKSGKNHTWQKRVSSTNSPQASQEV